MPPFRVGTPTPVDQAADQRGRAKEVPSRESRDPPPLHRAHRGHVPDDPVGQEEAAGSRPRCATRCSPAPASARSGACTPRQGGQRRHGAPGDRARRRTLSTRRTPSAPCSPTRSTTASSTAETTADRSRRRVLADRDRRAVGRSQDRPGQDEARTRHEPDADDRTEARRPGRDKSHAEAEEQGRQGRRRGRREVDTAGPRRRPGTVVPERVHRLFCGAVPTSCQWPPLRIPGAGR